MGGVALTAFIGVLGMNVGSAMSPVMTEQQRTAVLGARTAVANKAAAAAAAAKAKAAPPAIVTKLPAAAPKPVAPGRGHPWRVTELFVNPSSTAADQARAWAAARPADAAAMSRLAATPQARWFGDWNTNIEADVNEYVGQATAAGRMPVLVAYNTPGRDCNNYSAGGADTPAAYNAWLQGMVRGIAGRPAVVILEPDALPMLATCSSAAEQQERLQTLSAAVTALKTPGGTHVYLDAGNPDFQSVATMATRLNQANIAQADGFSLNISNFYTNAELVPYGTSISALVGGKHFVLDTSRNGNGKISGADWCNPPGRALGAVPTTSPSLGPLVDALLWIKIPGESDGTCNGGPNAGTWWPDYALGLARSAGW